MVGTHDLSWSAMTGRPLFFTYFSALLLLSDGTAASFKNFLGNVVTESATRATLRSF